MAWELTDAKNPQWAEVEKILKAAKKAGPRPRVMIVLGYNAALRVSELVHVRVADFNWTTARMKMIPLKKAGRRRIKQPDGTFVVVDRPLPGVIEYQLPGDVAALVKSYIAAEKLDPKGWLFPGQTTPGG